MIGSGEAGLGLGNLHTKRSERPDPAGTTNIEANLGGFEENLEEGPFLEERSFEEKIGETASKLETESTAENFGGTKLVLEGAMAASKKTGVHLDDEREADILGPDFTSSNSQAISDSEHRGEGDGREDVEAFSEKPTTDFQEVGRLLPPGENCRTVHEDEDHKTLGTHEDELGASCNLEVPKCASPSPGPRPLSQSSQHTPKSSARPRPNKLLPPSPLPPGPTMPSAPPPPLSACSSKSSYSAVPMAGLPLVGAVCGLCLGGPVVSKSLLNSIRNE